jgi:hypothetical protein
MRPQLQPPAAAMLAAMQLQQAGPVFRSVLDADVLTRLSPLSQLSKFELHLQQHLPCGKFVYTTSSHLHIPAAGGTACDMTCTITTTAYACVCLVVTVLCCAVLCKPLHCSCRCLCLLCLVPTLPCVLCLAVPCCAVLWSCRPADDSLCPGAPVSLMDGSHQPLPQCTSTSTPTCSSS